MSVSTWLNLLSRRYVVILRNFIDPLFPNSICITEITFLLYVPCSLPIRYFLARSTNRCLSSCHMLYRSKCCLGIRSVLGNSCHKSEIFLVLRMLIYQIPHKFQYVTFIKGNTKSVGYVRIKAAGYLFQLKDF